MKQRKISLNTLISLALVVLAVVSFLGFTSSYFTASATRKGNMAFANMNLRFACYYNDGGGDAYHPLENGKGQIKLFPAETSAIQRGVEFKLSSKSGGEAIKYLSIHNMDGSCAAYVRFWIDAYVENDETKTNYGKYFTLNHREDVTTTNAGAGRDDSKTVYCFKEALEKTGGPGYYRIGETITMSTSKEVDHLMGESITIYIRMEAVQANKEACLSVFGKADDTKGYYSGWVEES